MKPLIYLSIFVSLSACQERRAAVKFGDQVSGILCEKIFGCYSGIELDALQRELPRIGKTAAECESNLRSLAAMNLLYAQAESGHGDCRLNKPNAKRCLQSLSTQNCTAVRAVSVEDVVECRESEIWQCPNVAATPNYDLLHVSLR